MTATTDKLHGELITSIEPDFKLKDIIKTKNISRKTQLKLGLE